MPNTNTAKKNLRKNIRRRAINKPVFTEINTLKKKILTEVQNTQESSENTIISKLKEYFGKLHSKSRKNSRLKARASKFESRVVAKVKRKLASA